MFGSSISGLVDDLFSSVLICLYSTILAVYATTEVVVEIYPGYTCVIE